MRALGLLFLAACWTGAAAPDEPAPPEIPSTFEITMERTPCFGTCPVYRVSIDGDGRVKWRGIANVHALGEQRATVPAKRIAEIERKLEQLKFFELDEHGELPEKMECVTTGGTSSCSFSKSVTICSDTSVAVLTVRKNHDTYTVRNDHCKRSPLDALEALLDDIARTTAWIGPRVVKSPSS